MQALFDAVNLSSLVTNMSALLVIFVSLCLLFLGFRMIKSVLRGAIGGSGYDYKRWDGQGEAGHWGDRPGFEDNHIWSSDDYYKRNHPSNHPD